MRRGARSGYSPCPVRAAGGAPPLDGPRVREPVDRATDALPNAFAHGRFVMTSSFLFGIGFAMKFLRAEERGEERAVPELIAA